MRASVTQVLRMAYGMLPSQPFGLKAMDSCECLLGLSQSHIFTTALVAMACLLLLVVLLALLMLTGLIWCGCLAIAALWGLRGIWSLNVLHLLLCNVCGPIHSQ